MPIAPRKVVERLFTRAMKNRTAAGLVFVALVCLNGCQTTPTSWEYKRISHGGPLTETELDNFGHEGWILSGYTKEETPNGVWTEAILRRPKK
jgi:hypothetical protein